MSISCEDFLSRIGEAFANLESFLETWEMKEESLDLIISGLQNHLEQLKVCKRIDANKLQICRKFPSVREQLLAKIHAKVTAQLSDLEAIVQYCCDSSKLISNLCEAILKDQIALTDLSEFENCDGGESAGESPNHPDLSTLLTWIRDLPFDFDDWSKSVVKGHKTLLDEVLKQSSKKESCELMKTKDQLLMSRALFETFSLYIESTRSLKPGNFHPSC